LSAATQYDIGDLLEQAGARPRGNRHDCPKCGGYRTVTHSDEAFYCHRCNWKGNTITLAKGLGLYRRLPLAEYRELRRKRERAHETAVWLYERVRARRLELSELLRELGRLELLAHEDGWMELAFDEEVSESAWQSLETVYHNRPGIEAELDFLETASAPELMRFFGGELAL